MQKGQCAYRRAYRVMGKSSAKRSMHIQARVQARIQGDGEIKCKKFNARLCWALNQSDNCSSLIGLYDKPIRFNSLNENYINGQFPH